MGLSNMSKIPISVLVTTKNEERHIARCLDALTDFEEVIVIDSYSEDRTVEIAKSKGARVELYQWNGQYPKKRQWCLDNLNIGYDWIFLVDADEVFISDIIEEIRVLTKSKIEGSGFFVKGQYVWKGKVLKHGLTNNKLALFDRRKIEFPVIDDLDIEGMGEIEGHYQPILKEKFQHDAIGQITSPLLHYAYEDEGAWLRRHEQYAKWESEMIKRNVWPEDPVRVRQVLKKITRTSALRPCLIFLYSYIFKLGFLDGKAGFEFALSRKKYCKMVLKELRQN